MSWRSPDARPYPGCHVPTLDLETVNSPGRSAASLGAAPAGKRVLLAEPRGYCAGVDRAVETVERALEKHGAPVYVRHEIVHNKHVVDTLTNKGVVFVHEADEVPEGAMVVFSAHGVAPSVHDLAADRGLRVIDATCPLVNKVHNEAKRFARDGYDILLIGHAGHEEVVGIIGEAPTTSSWSTVKTRWPRCRCATRTRWCGCRRPR